MKKSNISFLLSGDVFSICRPLFHKFNLNAFSYSKIYTDGSRTELWTNPKAMGYSFLEKSYIGKFYTPQYLGKERIVIYEKKIISYPTQVRKMLEHQLADQRKIFNHDNALLIAEFNNDFWDFFFFYSPTENIDAINIYLSNMDELKKFCKYFKKRGNDLIKKADNDKLIKSLGYLLPQHKIKLDDSSRLIKLTKRENEIGYMLVEGKTAREISEIFCISKRTVEHHISNMKEKLGVHKKSALINILLKENNFY